MSKESPQRRYFRTEKGKKALSEALKRYRQKHSDQLDEYEQTQERKDAKRETLRRFRERQRSLRPSKPDPDLGKLQEDKDAAYQTWKALEKEKKAAIANGQAWEQEEELKRSRNGYHRLHRQIKKLQDDEPEKSE